MHYGNQLQSTAEINFLYVIIYITLDIMGVALLGGYKWQIKHVYFIYLFELTDILLTESWFNAY